MDYSCKTYVETDLASLLCDLHWAACRLFNEALSFDSNEFTNNRAYRAPRRTFLRSFFGVQKTLTNLNSKICHMTFSYSSQNHKVSNKIFVNNNFYHDKVIEKQSGLYLGLYVMSNLCVLVWIWIQPILVELTHIELFGMEKRVCLSRDV
jgi:hypothetical protein